MSGLSVPVACGLMERALKSYRRDLSNHIARVQGAEKRGVRLTREAKQALERDIEELGLVVEAIRQLG